MPRIDYDQVVGSDGEIISETIVVRPTKVISEEQMQQIRQTLKGYLQDFYPGGVPTGTPTANQQRNATIAIIGALQYLDNEMDG